MQTRSFPRNTLWWSLALGGDAELMVSSGIAPGCSAPLSHGEELLPPQRPINAAGRAGEGASRGSGVPLAPRGGLHVPIWGCVAKHPGLQTGAPLTLRWVLGCALRVLLSSISWDWCCGLCLSSARGSW